MFGNIFPVDSAGKAYLVEYLSDKMYKTDKDLKKINWFIIFISIGLMFAIMVLLLISF
jgi:hypothetical protein